MMKQKSITSFWKRQIIALFSLLCFFCLVNNSAVFAQGSYEKPPTLQAAKLLAGIPLKGELYEIAPEVTADGFLINFRLKSKYGTFTPHSPDQVKTLLVEINAIKQLDELEKSDVFVDGLKKSGKQIGEDVKTLVSDPVETAKGVGTGINRFFKRTYRATKTGVQKIGDRIEERDQPQTVESQTVAHVPGASTTKVEPMSQTELATAGAKAAGNTVANVFGYSEQRRQIAKNLKVDPYTTNQVLSEKLDDISWAAFAGGLGVSAIKMAVPASMVLSVSTTLTSWVWDMPPGDLRVFNEEKLLAMGVSQDNVDKLLRNSWFTFTYQGRLVRALMRLKDVENRPEVIALAVTVNSYDQALFVVEAVELLAHYHENVHTIKKVAVHATLIGQTEDAMLVIPAPLEYISWTERLDRFTGINDFQDRKPLIYLRGSFTDKAKAALNERGWAFKEKVKSL